MCVQQVKKIRKKQAILSHSRRADSDFLLGQNQLMPVKAGCALLLIAPVPPPPPFFVSCFLEVQPLVCPGATVLYCGSSGVWGVCLVSVPALWVRGPPVDHRGGQRDCVLVLLLRVSRTVCQKANCRTSIQTFQSFPKDFLPSNCWGLTSV